MSTRAPHRHRAPGVYWEAGTAVRTLTGERMDVAAFLGVAPRGPCRVPAGELSEGGPAAPRPQRVRSRPIALESWSEYVRTFGAFEGPGRLPYAVSTFFGQGGRRCWVVRIVHEYGDWRDAAGAAFAALPALRPAGPRGVRVTSRVRGVGAQGLRGRLVWRQGALTLRASGRDGLEVDAVPGLGTGALLRVVVAGSDVLRFVAQTAQSADGARIRVVLEEPVDPAPTAAFLVEARIEADGSSGGEILPWSALSPRHPRWLWRTLAESSTLLAPDPSWRGTRLVPHPDLGAPPPGPTLSLEPDGFARGVVPGARPDPDGLWLEARSEGAWGNRLAATLHIDTEGLTLRGSTPGHLDLPVGTDVTVGDRLLARDGGGGAWVRSVAGVAPAWSEAGAGREPQRVLRALLDAPLAAPPERVERLTARLRVVLGPGRAGRTDEREIVEEHAALALDPRHPRWMGTVLARGSSLVRVHGSHAGPVEIAALPGPGRRPVASVSFAGGEDRWADITPDDFFDAAWVHGDENLASGVHALIDVTDVALVVAPDLYAPAPLPELDDISDPPSLAGPSFEPCVVPAAPGEQAVPLPALAGLRLDPAVPAELERIVSHQRRLVELARRLRSFVVLLDVPPGLSERRVHRWRDAFDSDFAAAYHPWLRVSTEDGRNAQVLLNPSAAAAGVVALQEIRFGVPHGPANVVLAGVDGVTERVVPARHGALHEEGVNVCLQERDGVWIGAARTLSRDPRLRQLNVRRTLTLIARTLERRMAWTVFEPTGTPLREQIVHTVSAFLGDLWLANAFAGRTEEESWFVRCDATNNPPHVTDAGRLVAEIGVALAEPVEYLILVLHRGADGALRVEG